MKKALKQIHQSGLTNMESELLLSRALERVGGSPLNQDDPELAAAFLKFAVVTKELSNLKKTLVSILDLLRQNESLIAYLQTECEITQTTSNFPLRFHEVVSTSA
jgi:hypothetical protein